jgi:hypothetical protein
MKSKILLIVSIVVIFVVFIWWQQRSFNNTDLSQNDQRVATGDKLQARHIPTDWNSYTNEEWGITLAYPEDWELNENIKTGLVRLKSGCDLDSPQKICDYDISFSNRTGRGLPSLTWTHPEYVIGGVVAEKTWQADRPGEKDGYLQIIVVNDFLFEIYTPDKTKELSDRILSTVTFKEKQND